MDYLFYTKKKFYIVQSPNAELMYELSETKAAGGSLDTVVSMNSVVALIKDQ